MGMRRAKGICLGSTVGSKGSLQVAWFRVRHIIPHDSRIVPVLAYVGSLVGITLGIDMSSIYKQDYVKLKIGCRDVTKGTC